MSSSRRYLPFVTCVVAIACFYLYNLAGVGMMSTDEPRYAAIGQAMARTGDWVTPTLWGAPWFEKPPLLYWMSATFFDMGLKPEMAARLPVGLLSLAFLALAVWLVAREFGQGAALAIGFLATSAGWVAYSNFCLTDLPLAVFFSLALFLALPVLRKEPDKGHLGLRFLAIGACLGAAMLAKGLVPLALAVPLVWYLRRYWKAWWWAALGLALTAGPWYAAMWQRHGMAFVREFFLKHHLERIYSTSLQHVQPWYYYVPVLLAALFPWTPLFAIFAAHKRQVAWDQRRGALLATVLFGFLLFSASVNKLPGYLLPLLPALFVLLGAEMEGRTWFEFGKKWLLAPALLIALIPLIAKGLPAALGAGRVSGFHLGHIGAAEAFYVAAPLAALALGRRSWVNVLLVLCVVAGGLLLKGTAYPALDRQVSARGLWQEIERKGLTVCDGGINRDWAYGLSFYRGSELPVCGNGGVYGRELRAKGREKPSLDE